MSKNDDKLFEVNNYEFFYITSQDWIYDCIIQFIKSPSFNDPLREFIDKNCSSFDNKDENKLEHTVLHEKYKNAIEALLEFMLIDIGCNNEQFVKCAEIGLKIPEDRPYFEDIIGSDNFLYFKSKMVTRNAQLQEQAYKLMIAQENKKSQNALTHDEGYNALLRIKENTELECAIAMSLALTEEKRNYGFEVNEEDELLVIYIFLYI